MSFSVRVCAAVGSLPNWCKSSKTPPTHRCKLLLPNWCKTSNIPVLGFLPTALSSLLSFFPRWMERPRHHCLGPSTWLQICGPHQKGYVASLRPHVISLQPFLSLSLYINTTPTTPQVLSKLTTQVSYRKEDLKISIIFAISIHLLSFQPLPLQPKWPH